MSIRIDRCPECGGEADNGFDRCDPPNPYLCKACQWDYNDDAKEADADDRPAPGKGEA